MSRAKYVIGEPWWSRLADSRLVRRVACLLGRHRRKFDTYPQRGQCIYCGKAPEVTS